MPTPRRVGLNALFLDPGVSGGTETYLRQLVPALLDAAPQVRFEIVTTGRGAASLRSEAWAGQVGVRSLPCEDDQPARRTWMENAVLPGLTRRRGWEVVHSLANRGPRLPLAASVVTVHDAIFFRHRTLGRLSTLGMRAATRAAVQGADAVIAISFAAAAEVADELRLDRRKITVVPQGPGQQPTPPRPAADVRARYGLEGLRRTVLCVAAKRAHKNQALLVSALVHLPADAVLVLVGPDEGYGSELAALASGLGVRDRVRLLEGLDRSELEALWEMADCAAFPTLAEGFGLPVLEAMRRGVPVACSDIPVLREVADGAARFFAPDDPGVAAAAIESAMNDRELRERGPARAGAFSWARTARLTFEVYERALRAHSGA